MGTSFEARLQYLETRDDSYSRDFIRLKTENAELHNMVFELKRENSRAVNKLEQVQEDLKAVFGFRANIENRLGILEKSVTHLKDIDDRVSGLETTLNGFRQENACNNQSFHNRLVKLEEKAGKCVDNCGDQTLVEERLTRLEIKVTQQNDSLPAVEDRLKKLETNTNIGQVSLEDRIQKIENKDCNSSHQELELRLKKTEDDISLSQRRVDQGLKEMKDMKSDRPPHDFKQQLLKVQNNMTVFKQDTQQRLEKVQNGQRTSQQQIEQRLKKVEVETGTPKKVVEDRLDKIENDVTTFRQESTRHRQSMTDKMKNVERQSRVTERHVESLITRRGELSELKDTFYNKQTQEDIDTIADSVTKVVLNTSQQLETGEMTKLDKVTGVGCNTGGYFNVTSCHLEPPVPGKYLVNVLFGQQGTGKIQMHMKLNTGQLYIGMTVEDDDTCNTMIVLDLKKGDKLYLETIRKKGNAKLWECILTSWLISPEID